MDGRPRFEKLASSIKAETRAADNPTWSTEYSLAASSQKTKLKAVLATRAPVMKDALRDSGSDIKCFSLPNDRVIICKSILKWLKQGKLVLGDIWSASVPVA